MTSTSRLGYGRLGYTALGSIADKYEGFGSPWYVQTRTGGIRVDGLETDDAVSPVVPGQTVTYECVFLPQPSNGAAPDNHVERFTDVRGLLVKAPDVATYDPPGAAAYYREQHGATDGAQLVRIGPLAPEAGGDVLDETQPPSRDSVHDDRWAVVVGGTATSPLPDKYGTVSLETVTIASTETFATRDAVRNARENNGF